MHTFFSIPTSSFAEDVFWLAVVGLGLNEAAYMAEIVRAGIQTVDEGQTEAATGLGMSRGQTLRLVILPQAMRAIIPPTGNELISMLKTTSLVTAVPYTFDLYSRTRDLAVETFNPVPMLLIASTWYLFFTSILMVGQFVPGAVLREGGVAHDVRPAAPGARRRRSHVRPAGRAGA